MVILFILALFCDIFGLLMWFKAEKCFNIKGFHLQNFALAIPIMYQQNMRCWPAV